MIRLNSNLHLYKRNFTLMLFECYSSVIRLCNLYKGIYKSIYKSIYKGSLKWKNLEIFLPLPFCQKCMIYKNQKKEKPGYPLIFKSCARFFSRIIIIRPGVMNILLTNNI